MRTFTHMFVLSSTYVCMLCVTLGGLWILHAYIFFPCTNRSVVQLDEGCDLPTVLEEGGQQHVRDLLPVPLCVTGTLNCTHTYLCTYVILCVHTYVRTYVCMYIPTYIVHMYVHKCLCVHTYVCEYTMYVLCVLAYFMCVGVGVYTHTYVCTYGYECTLLCERNINGHLTCVGFG